jgi:hypothetical protein
MFALLGTPDGPAALVMGRFLYRLKKVFNIDKHTRAFPVSSSMSAPATGMLSGRPAKLLLATMEQSEPRFEVRGASWPRADRPPENTMARQVIKIMRGTRDMHHCWQRQG